MPTTRLLAQDAVLVEEVAKKGRNWSEIVSKHFPNRTSLAAKNRYSVLQRRREVSSEKSTPAPQESLPVLTSALDSSTPSISITGIEGASIDEYMRQSPTPSDFWPSNASSVSEASTPTFVPDFDWNTMSSASSSLLSSSPAQGLRGSFTPITYSPSPSPVSLSNGCDYTDLYVGSTNTSADTNGIGGQNLFDMAPIEDTVSQYSQCPTMGSGFLYPYYGNWWS